ncbi:hypothetical protein DPMN_068933 [Dreissena polymorpha]|uniref:Uncharacterized protein n=1 Tax=Dreissena polymorpha TaxID=45954 RepID=A0A9D3YY49_DREPO|nr:hypothetical protein DPMN_068933 [Dreissena polymorpha]
MDVFLGKAKYFLLLLRHDQEDAAHLRRVLMLYKGSRRRSSVGKRTNHGSR